MFFVLLFKYNNGKVLYVRRYFPLSIRIVQKKINTTFILIDNINTTVGLYKIKVVIVTPFNFTKVI